MSKLRCWPGCLAIVIKAVHPENVGVTVTVIRWIAKHEFIPEEPEAEVPEPGWLVKSPRPWFDVEEWERDPTLAIFSDSSLIPLQPPPGTQITDTDLHLTAPAQAPAAGVHCESQ